MGNGSGGGIVTIESVVRLTYKKINFDTSSKMPPRTSAGQRRIAFGIAPGKAGADPDFVRCMISREDLGREYYYRVFGCD